MNNHQNAIFHQITNFLKTPLALLGVDLKNFQFNKICHFANHPYLCKGLKVNVQMKKLFSKLESWLQDIALEIKLKNLKQAIKNHIKRYYRSYHIPFYIIALLLVYSIYLFIPDFYCWMLKILDLDKKIKPSDIGAGFIAIIGLILFFRRLREQAKQTENQKQQIKLQIDQRIDERFNSGVSLLGSSETSARTGAIYALYELAKEEGKYCKQIAQILCSHIRSKTNEDKYQNEHKKRPSNEIQTTIDLLFREDGLYAQDFAKEEGFPKVNLSFAYLVGANFTEAQCQGAILASTMPRGKFLSTMPRGKFHRSTMPRGNFGKHNAKGQISQKHNAKGKFSGAQCQKAFLESTMPRGRFLVAQCQGQIFWKHNAKGQILEAQCQGADFSDAAFQGAHTDVNIKYPIRAESW
ncbi:MAG: pentapeptide repeat-containing protein [Candidatus Thiodubiliella endoseptemdiera]|uniref:Pentapeptide repeat-containing protein n=1 Tax=Candidatus Thiodubiliella endoseptemdiera TaxID=2738886 RepID=A0A853F005_9GAMM|nr:pentapeptide repeat-containing protein [Candidatus Thiodubiliella endoseptemdiera]